MKSYPRIIQDKEICHGKPVFEGTRIMVWQILELMEVGLSSKKIYKEYPTLPKKAIEAALHYAAEQAQVNHYDTPEQSTSRQVFT